MPGPLALLLALACAGGGDPLDTGPDGGASDGGASGASDGGASDGGASDGGARDGGADPCEGAPTVTWASFGHGFLLESCQGCHASTAPDRHGAPDDVVFDTVDDAWAWAPRILARAATAPVDMPPMGGTTEDDQARLRWWLTCAPPGT